MNVVMFLRRGKSIKNLSNVNKRYKLHKAGMKNALTNSETMLKLKKKTVKAVDMIFQLV